MDNSSVTGIASLISQFAALGSTFFIGSISLLVWTRTGSTQMLMGRLWKFFWGKSECNQKVVKEFLDCEAAVMQFQFHTGVKAKTLKQVTGMISWGKKNDIPMDEVAACGNYFNYEQPGLIKEKMPSAGKVLIANMVLPIFLLGAMFFVGCSIPNKVFLRITSTGKIFLLDEYSANVFGEREKLLLNRCGKPGNELAAETGFSAREGEVICAASHQNGFTANLKAEIAWQRAAFLAFALVIGAICFRMNFFIWKSKAAIRLDKTLTRRQNVVTNLTIAPEPPLEAQMLPVTTVLSPVTR